MPALLHYPLCPSSRAIRLALDECGVMFDLEQVKPWEWGPEVLEINPAAALPVWLQEGEAPVCGLYPISEYLADCRFDRADDRRAFMFFPGEPDDRAEVRRLVEWFTAKFDAEVSAHLLQEKVYSRFSGSGGPDMDAVRAARDNLKYHLSYVDFLLDGRNWLAGNALSFADLVAGAHVSAVDYLGEVPWQAADGAKDWYARLKSRPSFRTLLAERVAGITPPEDYEDPDF